MLTEFETRQAASAAAAETIVAALERRLASQRRAAIVVSGGSTPEQTFAALSVTETEWDRADIVLSDERWVPPSDEDSNEKLVRDQLLTGNAAGARLLPIYDPEASIDERVTVLNGEGVLLLPFACTLLGMGADGHFASLFPDADNLDTGLNVDSRTFCVPVATAASPHPRVSLTLAALSRSDEIVLLIFGDKKLEVLESAKQPDSTLPVARPLMQKRAPVNVYWAP